MTYMLLQPKGEALQVTQVLHLPSEPAIICTLLEGHSVLPGQENTLPSGL